MGISIEGLAEAAQEFRFLMYNFGLPPWMWAIVITITLPLIVLAIKSPHLYRVFTERHRVRYEHEENKLRIIAQIEADKHRRALRTERRKPK